MEKIVLCLRWSEAQETKPTQSTPSYLTLLQTILLFFKRFPGNPRAVNKEIKRSQNP